MTLFFFLKVFSKPKQFNHIFSIVSKIAQGLNLTKVLKSEIKDHIYTK